MRKMPAVAAAAAVDSKFECYVCGGNHMARDCRNCWQCGSASHMAAECDKYSKMYHEIMTAHADCRSLTVAAAIAFDEGKIDDVASALAEMNTILTKTDDVVFDLFGPGPRCARCDDDEAAEWAFAERTIPAPWVIAGAEDAKAPPGAAEDPDGTVSQRAAFHDMHRPESRSLDIFEPPTPHTVPFSAQALCARIQKVGLSPPGAAACICNSSRSSCDCGARARAVCTRGTGGGGDGDAHVTQDEALLHEPEQCGGVARRAWVLARPQGTLRSGSDSGCTATRRVDHFIGALRLGELVCGAGAGGGGRSGDSGVSGFGAALVPHVVESDL